MIGVATFALLLGLAYGLAYSRWRPLSALPGVLSWFVVFLCANAVWRWGIDWRWSQNGWDFVHVRWAELTLGWVLAFAFVASILWSLQVWKRTR